MTASTRSIEAIKNRDKPVALRDLAELASVDISTVSRALNHDPRVSEERASQIRRLAAEVGYRPRPMRSKMARSVGLLVHSKERQQVQEGYQSRIAWHVQRRLTELQLHMNLACVGGAPNESVPAIVQQNRVDGVILVGHPPRELVARISELGMPAVAINDSVERLGISCVRSNPEPAIHQAILNLAARGHVHFGLLLTSSEYPTSKARHHSYIATLKELSIEPREDWVVTGLHSEISGGRKGIQTLMERGSLPTALLCENDWMALGALHELQNVGLRVPHDVSLVGHDDLWICEQLNPALTSIRRSEALIVAKAIDLLLDQIDGNGHEPKELFVEGEMVWRQSAGAAPHRLKDHETPT